MNFDMMYRLATIFTVISTARSKFTIMRGEIDSVKTIDLPGSSWEYKCIKKSTSLCECYFSYKTIFSKNDEILKCQIDKLCKEDTMVLSSVLIPIQGIRPTIKSIEFWNIKNVTENTGVWEDKTDIVTKKYVNTSKNALMFEDSVKSDWKGQLFKVTFKNPKISCITLKIVGQIEYPFNFDKIFPPPRQTTTTTIKTPSSTTIQTSTKASSSTTKKSTALTTEATTTTSPSTTTKSQPTSIPPSKQDQTDKGGDNLPIYVALAVVSVVVIILLVVVFLLWRRRSANEKGKEEKKGKRIELSSNNAKFDNPNYLQTLKSSHQIENQGKYNYSGSATLQQHPREPAPLPLRDTCTLPTKPDDFYETVDDGYLQALDSWHLPGNEDERLRQFSVLSVTSQCGLLSRNSAEQSENLYADITSIQENYEPQRTHHYANNPTYQGIQRESVHNDALGNANAIDVYAPLQENIFTNGQESYAALDTKPPAINNISNAAYETDNFYHVLEK